MARTDIKFGQAQQADFGQANQMYRLAQDLTQQALQSGQNTLTAFNTAVKANNDATIKEFINSFSKDELANNGHVIDEFIKDISAKTGGMYSRGAIADYRDGRMSELITRDNQAMLNKEKQLQHQDVLDTYTARDLFNPIVAGIHQNPTNPDNSATFNKVLSDSIASNQYNDNVIAKLSKAFRPETVSALTAENLQNEAHQKLATTETFNKVPVFTDYLKQKELVDGLANNLNAQLQNGIISQEQYNASRATVNDEYARLNKTMAQAVASADPTKQSANFQALTKLVEASKVNQQAQTKSARKAEIELAKLKLQQQIADNTKAYQDGQLKLGEFNANTSRINADTGSARLGFEMATKGNGSTNNKANGSASVDKHHPHFETLTKFNWNANDIDNVSMLQDKFHTRMRSIQADRLNQDKLSYRTRLQSEEGKEAIGNLRNSNLPFENNLDEIEKTFPKGVDEGTKFAIVKGYADRYAQHGYLQSFAINKENSKILANNYKLNRDTDIKKAQQEEAIKIIQAMGSVYPNMTPESFTALMLQGNRLTPDVLNTLGENNLNHARARLSGMTVGQYLDNQAKRQAREAQLREQSEWTHPSVLNTIGGTTLNMPIIRHVDEWLKRQAEKR